MPRCPVCRTQTDLIKYEGVPIHNCGTCGGHWLSGAKLNVILAKRDIAMPNAVQAKMIALADASNSVLELWCLTCGTAMLKGQFKHWPDIQLDCCPKCRGVWLDRGELEKCQIYWEYLQDHPESPTADRAARIATLDARWAERKARLEDQVDRLRTDVHTGAGAGAILADLFSLGTDIDPGSAI